MKTPRIRRLLTRVLATIALFLVAAAANAATVYPVPSALRSDHYRVEIDGRQAGVVHAAGNLYFVNFDTAGSVSVTVTASDPHFWDRGVEIQPMRLGIRPVRRGATLRFRLPGPEKVSISRPGDHFAHADMLFLFANPPDASGITAQTPGVRYYGPGVHRGSIDAASGDTIYLAGGAVVFGSLNIWQVHDVHVLGRGIIVYDGPQNPNNDQGWMHKRNWHAIVMDHANNVEIDGITTVVRSRTWQIQMKDSRHIGFYNVKVLAATPGNANQDGMDWLGGGDTTVRDSFFRASDDVFALQGNWEGYTEAEMRVPGHDVTNISIEGTTVSTSISNTVRVAWPQKHFNSSNFHMWNMDVLDTGYGDCKVPFAFFELWANPDGSGAHAQYQFSDIRLEDWYSLFQLRQDLPSLKGFHFSNIWAMDAPAMVPSVVKGDVRDVTLDDVPGTPGRPNEVLGGAEPPEQIAGSAAVDFHYTAGALRPRQRITFTADESPVSGMRFLWLFGDGTRGEGRVVRHAFPDKEGTLLDGSGRFRVLLHGLAPDGTEFWRSKSVVVAERPLPAMTTATEPMERTVMVPVAGGYTFTVLTRSQTSVQVDDQPSVLGPAPQAGVCGSTESAMQPVVVSAVLARGPHRLHIETPNAAPGDEPVVLWEGPGLPRQMLK